MAWSFIEAVLGLLLLTWGADRLVLGASVTARKLGVTPLLIGLTIVALGTSAPEILVSMVSSHHGKPDLAVGNAIGSNIVNIGLVLGLATLLRPIKLGSQTVRREMAMLLAVSLLVLSLFLDSRLSRFDGLVLLAGLVIILIWLVKVGLGSPADDPLVTEFDVEIPQYRSLRSTVFWLATGLVTLLVGAECLVDGAVSIARFLGVTEVVIGIVLVAFGTSLPELAVSLVGALRGEYGMVLGNVIGSNIFNSLAVIGVAAVIKPAPLAPSIMSLHMLVMTAFTLALFAMTCDRAGHTALGPRQGLGLLAAYLAYEAYTVMSGFAAGPV